jgi:hypothetical protein
LQLHGSVHILQMVKKSETMVKNLLGLLLIVLLTVGVVVAQGNGGSGSGNGNHGHGLSGTQAQTSPYQNWPMPVRVWLDGGGQGQIPMLLVARVRLAARPWLMQTFGLSNGQIMQKWANGEIVMTYLPTSPPTPTLFFRVSLGGGLIIIEIGDEG